LSKPGGTISIHNLNGIMRDAFDLPFTEANKTAIFKKTGVWPFDTTEFIDDDFESSAVTERPA